MLNNIYNIYAYLFGKSLFIPLNKVLYRLGLRGLGVQNYSNLIVTGERYSIKKFIKGKVKPVVFDVGSNVGEFSLLVNQYNITAEIHAFEPNKIVYRRLLENVSCAPNINPVNIGLYSKTEEMKLYTHKDDKLMSQGSIQINKNNKDHISHDIKLITIDEYCKTKNIPKIDYLKIDSEGSEYDILLGAKKMLENGNIEIIQFEFSSISLQREERVTINDYVKLLRNYEMYRMLTSGLYSLDGLDHHDREVYGYQNIIALKR